MTHWRSSYRRHTNFAMESMEQTFSGTADFARKVSCLVSRNGDLIHKAYLQVDLPALTANASSTVAWTRNVGHVLIDYVNVEVGGAIIDQHYGQWFTIYNELTQSAEKADGYDVMIGNTAVLTTQAATIPAATVYIPLIFFWNRHSGLALPLIALIYHDVKINFSFRDAAQCYVTPSGAALTATPHMRNCSLFIDYVFLDGAERRMFSQTNQEYLIEQVQCSGSSGDSFNSASIRETINFSHPTKELVWVAQLDSAVLNGVNRWTDFTDNGSGSNPYAGANPCVNAKIQLNTHDRITQRPIAYFNLLQPYFHHTRVPATGINVYSFSIEPERLQPTGSINLSRIENVTLNLNLSTGSAPIRIFPYAVNINVFRVTGGMGGIAYAS